MLLADSDRQCRSGTNECWKLVYTNLAVSRYLILNIAGHCEHSVLRHTLVRL
jgi:hypothetical protein